MKLNKSILAAVLSLGAVSLASAVTTNTVYMTGSTAFRSSVYSAIIAPGVVFTAAPQFTVFQGGSTGSNAGNGGNYMAFVGTQQGTGTPLILQCHWSGSEAGVLDVASNSVVTESFMDPSLIDGNDHGTNLPSSTVSHNVDLAMADAKQAYSRTTKPTVSTNAFVGIVTFTWVRNPGWWTGSNVTDSQIRQSLSGYAPLAVFTGNAADTGSYVYVTGRDYSSGTRVNAFGDTGFGVLGSCYQIEMTSAGVMTANVPYQGGPAVYYGDFGFSSGGTEAASLGAVTTNAVDQVYGGAGFSVIGYLGRSDANTATNDGATELTYDGVPFSTNNIIEGTYPFWGNEYILAANADAGSTVVQTIFLNLKNTSTGINHFLDDSSGKGIKIGSMHTTRQGPVTDPVHN
jgi:hypothetical protein